jgi:hypothetical protein
VLLPIVCINSKSRNHTKVIWLWAILWAYGQINWARHADAFENHGEPTIAKIQDANYLWFLINMGLLSTVLYLHEINATKDFFVKAIKSKAE